MKAFILKFKILNYFSVRNKSDPEILCRPRNSERTPQKNH